MEGIGHKSMFATCGCQHNCRDVVAIIDVSLVIPSHTSEPL